MAENNQEVAAKPDVQERFAGYGPFLEQVKQRIRAAQTQASLAVNRELLELYWHLGKAIVVQQAAQGWGDSVLPQLAKDLQTAFPGISGFSRANLYRIRAFYLAYRTPPEIVAQAARQLDRVVPPEESMPQAVAQIPWFHNVILLEKVKDPAVREWYARATYEHGWSRNILEMQIESRLHERQGKAVTNFARTLPPPQSDLAQALLKDPYHFEFLTLGDDAHEREIERGLLEHIRLFLLEMGAGFAFVGSQYPLEVDGKDYYLDLLFYHLKLRCFVVIDLKVVEFQPEFVGKMNFYLAAVDDTLRHESDAPSIGLLLCRRKLTLTVEYALRNVATPIGVAEFVTDLARRIEAELNVGQREEETNKEDACW